MLSRPSYVMGDSNPMSDFIVPLLSFLVVLTASVLLFAKLGTMDLPSKADLMTLVLRSEDVV